MNSEYDVGTHIDLSHMNGKSQKKSFQEAVGNACEVGTTFIFKVTNQGLKAARRIPVVYA